MLLTLWPLLEMEQVAATDTPELEVVVASTDIEVVSADSGETVVRE